MFFFTVYVYVYVYMYMYEGNESADEIVVATF